VRFAGRGAQLAVRAQAAVVAQLDLDAIEDATRRQAERTPCRAFQHIDAVRNELADDG
jgi:hypothetical protein